jgi:hypothetical protein
MHELNDNSSNFSPPAQAQQQLNQLPPLAQAKNNSSTNAQEEYQQENRR